MTLSTNVFPNLPQEIFEKVLIGQDLSSLKPSEKFEYLKKLSSSLGLNPYTKPFEIMKFNNKEIPYIRKDGTEQLRKINKVSVRSLETKMIDNSVYIVTAFACLPDGREDSSIGVVNIKGLAGDALANAMMKAETKAKRRVTLSICGLGFMDESEIDSIKNRKNVSVYEDKTVIEKVVDIKPLSLTEDTSELEIQFAQFIGDINSTQSEEELRNVFNEIKKVDFKSRQDLFKELINAKDNKKMNLWSKNLEVN